MGSNFRFSDWYQTAQHGRDQAMCDHSQGRRMTDREFSLYQCSDEYRRAYDETYDFHVAQLAAPLNAADLYGP